jgi:excisionase family DNA binding protein
MTTVREHTAPPPVEPDAGRLLELFRVLDQDERAVLLGADGAQRVLPDEVYEILRDVVKLMAAGQAVTVAPHNTSLTTQEAADLLGISRPTLVRLLEEQEIPFQRPGRHRRVALMDLIGYQQRISSLRRKTLDEMSREAAEDDSYERLDGFIKTR